MFIKEGEIVEAGDSIRRPGAPATVTAATAVSSDSEFTTGFAGDYYYAVHAINAYGISPATPVSGQVSVAAGNKVTLTIAKPTTGGEVTGYIITRSNAGGSKLMEMVRIPATGPSVTFVDLNKDLPGTASIVLLTPSTDEMKPNTSFGQLMGMSNFDLPTDSSLAHRGVVAL